MSLQPATPGAGTMPAPGRSATATGQPGPNNLGQRSYNSPPNSGDAPGSDIGNQFNTFFWQKKALVEAKKTMFFGQMADTTSMPKHFGKTIKKYHYLPLLDDANINDQGIDANGAVMTQSSVIEVRMNPPQALPTAADPTGDITKQVWEGGLGNRYPNNEGPVYADNSHYKFFVTGADEAAAAGIVIKRLKADFGITVTGTTAAALQTALVAKVPGALVLLHTQLAGNLYGSSKDVGTIVGKMPALSEFGGRVNRVGFRRVELQGTLQKFGFFDEYTQESLDFDTDSQLEMHVNREMLNGAAELTEDALQIDLLNAAGVVRFGGVATMMAELKGGTTVDTGAATDASVMSWEDLLRLSIELDQNRCPKDTKIITGSRMIDTKVIGATRYMFIGSELLITLRNMRDNFKNPAFIPVEAYGAAGNIATGEAGSIGMFRVIVVPEMMRWEGKGAASAGTDGYYETGGKYDVFPMLVIGSESFTTIGFQTDGKTVKFKITHRKPGTKNADRMDPYGETGFMSVKWYYGFMILRPERIAICKVVAKM